MVVTKEMNEAAIAETKRLFPDMPDINIGHFFVCCTPYPAIPVAECMDAVRDLAARSGGDYEKALAISNEDMEKEWVRGKIKDELVAVSYQFKAEFGKNPIPITITRQTSPFYSGEKWAVRRAGNCLGKDGEWDYESIPSERDEAFYKKYRFDSLEEAFLAVKKAKRD